MTNVLAVGCGGFLGALARYGVGLLVGRFFRGDFPLATFLINVSGSFALGLFATMGAERLAIPPAARLLVATGFLGAFTTFSTFEWETHRLAESGARGQAAVNVVASVAAGYLAVRLGATLGR